MFSDNVFIQQIKIFYNNFILFFFLDRNSLCSRGYPRTHGDPCASGSLVMWLQAWSPLKFFKLRKRKNTTIFITHEAGADLLKGLDWSDASLLHAKVREEFSSLMGKESHWKVGHLTTGKSPKSFSLSFIVSLLNYSMERSPSGLDRDDAWR